MPRLKVLSGEETIKILLSFGFEEVSRRGSHVKLKRFREDGLKQTLTVPDHKELDRGTLHAIYRQAARYVSEEELSSSFYHD